MTNINKIYNFLMIPVNYFLVPAQNAQNAQNAQDSTNQQNPLQNHRLRTLNNSPVAGHIIALVSTYAFIANIGYVILTSKRTKSMVYTGIEKFSGIIQTINAAARKRFVNT